MDPTADKVENEEYLEEELNNMMKSYKQNEINRDIEEQKREKLKEAEKERIEAEKSKKIEELDEEDPWMKSCSQMLKNCRLHLNSPYICHLPL